MLLHIVHWFNDGIGAGVELRRLRWVLHQKENSVIIKFPPYKLESQQTLALPPEAEGSRCLWAERIGGLSLLMGRTTNRWAREVTGDCSGASFIRVWPVWDRKAGCCARRTDEREGSEGRNGRVVCSVFFF